MKREDLNKLRIDDVVEVRGNHHMVTQIGIVRDILRPRGMCAVDFPGGKSIAITYKLLRKVDIIKEDLKGDIEMKVIPQKENPAVKTNQPEPYQSEKAKYEELMKESLQRQYDFIEREKEKLFRERDLYESAFDAKLETLNQMITEIYNEEIFLTHKIGGDE